jgi:AcrR family transcriptional regulator
MPGQQVHPLRSRIKCRNAFSWIMTDTGRRPGRPGTGGKRERTRAALIEAAARLIGTQGYHGTSLEDVAKAAGMSRGAIYGNFKDRDELFLAVLEARWQPIIPPFRPGAGLKEQMRILAQAVIAAAPQREKVAARALEFRLYALTHPRMRARLARHSAQAYRIAQAELLKFVPAQALPMPPAHFVRVVHALIEGLLLERFESPGEVTDEVILAALEALAGDGTAGGGQA